MLQLKNICKSYTTGDFTQVALDDVSLSFRDNEFVAILGPSGSGKTTLLNIVGGLDHYDSGDLLIDGISTKDYRDKDWDTFRNNRVGFIFQSYNLIPHQSILANVELALTLSGVGREERRKRALEVLEKVGLSDHINKKPNQLSGGQMQRVAIARALINDPEIVLADEPTGALDSKTSIQIMDLLTEIAKDRLVVMVTHNPELAEQYATRIVTLSDGVIRADTDSFAPTEADMHANDKVIRPARMSFLTAISLSFNNLMSKKGRTIMTALAGSIGIIGIAAILSLANGVNNYIKSVEEETLSVYPLQITSTGFDFSAMMMGHMGMGADDGTGADDEGEDTSTDVGSTPINEASIMTKMFSSIGNNDLKSLKEYLDSGQTDIDQYAQSIEYTYNVTPNIFSADTENGIHQINPDTTFSSLGMGSGGYTNSLMSSMMSTDMFGEMVDLSMIEDQYDVKAGHWPEKYNECVLVLTENGSVSDFLLYVVGLRDHAVVDEMVRAFNNEEEIVITEDDLEFTYDDFLNLKMKLVNSADFYQYDPDFDVWVDKSDDEDFMRPLIDAGEDMVISGIVQKRADAKANALNSGIYYLPSLIDHIVDEAGQTQIVQEQLADPSIDVFNGKPFGEEGSSDEEFDMSSMFTIDENALRNAFQFDASALEMDTSALESMGDAGSMGDMDMSSMDGMMQMDPSIFETENGPTLDPAGVAAASARIQADFNSHLVELDQIVTSQGISQSDPRYGNAMVQAYMSLPSTSQLVSELMPDVIDTTAMEAEIQAKLGAYMEQVITAYVNQITMAMMAQVQVAVEQMMMQFAENMSSAMHVDVNAFQDAFQMNVDEDEISDLIMSMMASEQASFDNNLARLDYAQMDKPYEIDIFAKDFESKQHITSILDEYNDKMKAEGEEDKEVTYTDLVGTLMSSVTTIIDMISYVLIAFVSISLVVSSIMIGIITYISVLERRKEIGILRAVGASKHDVSLIFNAETVIEGFAAGVLGVVITALACIPASAIVYSLMDVPNVASLPVTAALILVAISVFLSFIAGLIPASSASRKDPVEALRSE